MSRPPVSLKARAIAALARREHSRLELARKLSPHAESKEELDRLLQELESKNLLSDQRFAESFVRLRGVKFGASLVAAGLRQLGVPQHIVASHADRLRGSEQQRAWAVWSKRFGAAPETQAHRAQQIRFLLARGFSLETYRDLESRQFERPPDDG